MDNYFSLQNNSQKTCLVPEGGSANPDSGTQLVFNDGCMEERQMFQLLPSGYLQHKTSGQYLVTRNGGRGPNSQLIFYPSIGGNFNTYSFQSNGTLRHNGSGLCVHPNGGVATSGQTIPAILDYCPSDQASIDRIKFNRLSKLGCCTNQYSDSTTDRNCGVNGYSAGGGRSSPSCDSVMQLYCAQGDNYLTTPCVQYLDSPFNVGFATPLLQQKCATSSTFSSPTCKKFCSDPKNKAFCDQNITNFCRQGNYADSYCSCLKPMTLYPKYNTFSKIYDALTQCYVDDCINSDGYKIGGVQCPDCLQIMNISGTDYNASDIKQICDISGKPTQNPVTPTPVNPNPPVNPTPTNPTPPVDPKPVDPVPVTPTNPSTNFWDKIKNLNMGEKVSIIIFVILILGVLFYAIFGKKSNKK